MTPNTPNGIKAFYAADSVEDEDAAAAAAAAAAEAAAAAAAAAGSENLRSSGGGRCSIGSSASSAFEVLQFHPAEPEPQVCLVMSAVPLDGSMQCCSPLGSNHKTSDACYCSFV